MPCKSWMSSVYAALGLEAAGKSKAAPRSRSRAWHGRRLGMESLESRQVLSGSPGAQITGIAFSDLLQNGQPAGQPALQGVTVNLYKDGGNASFDGGIGVGADDTLVGGPIQTNASGQFTFSVSAAGTYFVKETAPNGYAAPNPVVVTVTANDLLGTQETTIDGFTTTQTVSANPSTPDQGSTIAAPEAIGGHRDLSVHLISASGQILFEANPAFDLPNSHLLHFDTLGNTGTGTYTVAWDGVNPNTPPTLNYTGLGGVNLAANNATGISLSIGADHDASTATFNIYKDANNWSTVTITIPGPSDGIDANNPNQDVFVPFSSFTIGGGTGAGDFTNVGAIQLAIGGTIPGLNGQISFIATMAPTILTANLANTPETDLSITKTDGKTSVVPGTSNTYTIVVTNVGPNAVNGAHVTDTFPGIYTNVTYTASATGGATGFTASGSGNIDDAALNMPVGSTITYIVTGTVSASATGTLVNTTTVATPSGVTDPTPANNTATDTDTLTPQADLQITKTDNKTTIVPGSSNTYTIVVTNAGPSTVTGATITDTFPAGFTGVTYTASATGGATGFTASGSGNISQSGINMPVGSTITYTVTGTVSASATGTLVNTATVSPPTSVTDPTPANNTATDTDTLTPQADLQITKTDGKTSILPSSSNTYTIVVTNAGPSAVSGATITDTFPATFTGVTWTAVATGGASGFTASGSGNISQSGVSMPVGSTITYTVTGTVSAAATGTLVNTATVAVPAGVTDPTPANNSATDTDTLSPQADLQITKTDNKTTVVPGASNSYTIVVTNAGPSAVSGATITDTFPATFTGVTWTAVAAGGASGFAASGSGSISQSGVTMPVGSTITYTVTGTVSGSASGNLVNTASVAAPAGVTDPTPANNTATDTDTITAQTDLQITKTDNKTTVVPGTTNTYTIVVTNAGPAAVTGATITDNFPGTFTNVTYTATATGGATGFAASGSGNINHSGVNMPVGSTITYTVTGTVSSSATGTIANTATVAAPAGVTDSTPANNTATDTDTLTPQSDLSITKTDNKTHVTAGQSNSYTIVVTNSGPSAANGVTIADNFASIYTGVTWTATATGGATGFAASGSGNINATNVNMPSGSTITYTVTGTVSASATGTLVNTATVTPPTSSNDLTLTNNTATDTDTIDPTRKLSKALFLGRY